MNGTHSSKMLKQFEPEIEWLMLMKDDDSENEPSSSDMTEDNNSMTNNDEVDKGNSVKEMEHDTNDENSHFNKVENIQTC